MGNRITFDEISQQLCSIYRVALCNFQNEVQNDSPYLVRYGQLESVIGNFCKEATDGFIRFKSFHRTQDVILHHSQGKAGYLSGKMHRLTFAKVQQGLAILVCNFSSPTFGINSIRFKEAKRKVCSQQPIPVSLTSSFAKEQTDWHAIQLNVHCTIGTAKRFVVPACLLLVQVLDDLLGVHITMLRCIVGFAQFDHAQQVAFDMSAGNETHKLSVCKPAIYEQVVEADTSLDGILDHIYGLVCLLHQVFVHTLLYRLSLVVLGIASLTLLISLSLIHI